MTILRFVPNLVVRSQGETFRSSSMAEHSAVNRRVVSSSLTCGANLIKKETGVIMVPVLHSFFEDTLDSVFL